ncbi:MAG: hypothetical protein KY461_00500 [Actinobacteria bacterium]|nr:hypothetical protein [Actinomycetota bacterium]
MSVRARLLVALLAGTVLLASGCAGPDEPDGPLTDVPTEGAVGDEPVPVEGDGGIGGEGGGPVTSNLILSAEQVEVTATCLLSEAPPTYRLDLAAGDSLTVTSGDAGGAIVLLLGGTTFTSPEDQPPAVTVTEGAMSVQGRAVSEARDEHFVDAVIGLDDLPDC